MSNLVETSLDISARVLAPFQESDSSSLSFAIAALALSVLYSWFGISPKGNNLRYEIATPPPEENEIEKSIMKIRNNLIFHDDELLTKPHKNYLQPDRKTTSEEYEKALKAFEKFMAWSKVESQDKQFLEDVLELAISKARGKVDPSDVFYEYATLVVTDVVEVLQELVGYYFS